jgi:glycosyltransferase involved in cell wall biosynthesis
MRIGIDAKWYFTGPVSTRVVFRNLLPELFALYPEHDWIVFLDKKDKGEDFPFQRDNIKVRYVWADNNLLSNLFVLPGQLRKLKVDVMLFQTFPGLKETVPSVAFIHDVLFRGFPQFFGWKERLYFLPLSWLTRHRVSRLVATTEFVAGELLKYHYTGSRAQIDLVPLAVTKMYKPLADHHADRLASVKEKFGLPDRYLLYVGRLNVRKNIENLLKALILIRDPTIGLVIVGKEDRKVPDLEALLADPRISKRIILTGGMDDGELTSTYAMANIFCFPSYAEGFGLPPLEAMASGVPVIVSQTTSMPEVCGEAAVYIDPSRPESIARALDDLLGNEDLYDRKRVAGLERAGQFTWARTAHALMESLHKACKNQ